MTPTTLLMHMRPLSSDSTTEEFSHQFKSVMPPGVRTALAGRKFDTIEAYAEAADDVAETIRECTSVYMVSRPSKKDKGSDTPGLCFYHTRFGSKAQKCRAPCKFTMTGPPVAPAPGSFSESFQHTNQSGDTQTLLDHSVYAVDNGDTAIPLLYLTDRHSGTRFLVDSGATVSIFPASLQDQKTRPQTTPLIAANGSHIATYGTRKIRLDLGFRQTSWSFRLATVTKPILGLDFLSSEQLAVDFQRRTLHAVSPHARREDGQGNCAILHVATPDYDQWSSILSEFPSITVPNFDSPINKHGVFHYIPTTGPPPHVRARRLPPDRLAEAKKAFEDMIADGICRRSSSPYAAPLHMVSKFDGSWRPCGDYRLLNASTINDRYPVPHIQDFNVAPFSPRSTFERVITRFQWRPRTFTKQQSSNSSHHSLRLV